jgi:hypothetical protein
MKFTGVAVLITIFLTSSFSLLADDWKTTDGKTYQDVKVVDVQPDTVTILHHDGGATIPMTHLSPEVQKQFNYDPAKAKLAADNRSKEEIENAKEMQAEMDEAERMTEARLAQESNASNADSTSDNSGSDSSTTASKGGSHYTLGDLDASIHSLRDASGAIHYSMSSLTLHTLRAAPDPSHHTMGEIANSGL